MFDDAVNALYDRALRAARKHLDLDMPLILSYMGPSPNTLAFLKGAIKTKGVVLADHHYYLNWQVHIAALTHLNDCQAPIVPSYRGCPSDHPIP